MRQKCLGTVHRAWQDTVDTQFVDSLATMLLHSQATLCGPNEFINYNHSTVSWFELGRQEAVEQALGEWIFFTDTDHKFAPDMLERLVLLSRKHKCRVLSGLYLSKPFGNHYPVARVWKEDGHHEAFNPSNEELAALPEVMEIGPCGAGCLLVYRNVFRELAAKFPGQLCFGTIPGLSEDYSFFKRCHDAGIKTYLAPHVESAHLTARSSVSVNFL